MSANHPGFIPVAAPALVGNEVAYVMDCLQSSWISSSGHYIGQFEAAFAEFCGSEYALSCSNGTVALHLALLAHGVRPLDEIILPTLTYVATANAVSYCGAKAVLVDSEPKTWNIDTDLIERAITPRTRGIIVVHLFGHPVDMEPVLRIAHRHGLFVIEDAAEAHGAEYQGKRVGSIGDVATFSFYGNKIITTGEGGMVTTSDGALASRIAQLKGQGQDPERRYWFPIVGYNYRMTNIEAAIGLAQLERISWHIAQRQSIAAWYKRHLGHQSAVTLQPQEPWAKNVYWMNSVVLGPDVRVGRDTVMQRLLRLGIETRPFFYAMHMLPTYNSGCSPSDFPVATWLSQRGINLPSSAQLTEEAVAYICRALLDVVEGC